MTPDGDRAICTGADQPWLLGNPSNLQHPQTITHVMPAQDLERHDERICKKVAVYARMEDLYRAVIRRRCEQRIRGMEM
jgi:hypothetical protein